jgi:sterol desaturase/sphingolipid hydroxylase (fatty acid hydroxylase superfamily)
MSQSRVSYFADMIASPLLGLLMGTFVLSHFPIRAIVLWFLFLIIGAALWTLAEYLMHRLVYHHVPFFAKYHDAHHLNPRAFVGAPPMMGTTVIFLVSFLPLAPVSTVIATGVSAGMLVGYTIYMIVHHACHFSTPMRVGYFYRIRLHHAAHHYRDGNGNFGVSTSFWDSAFGTRIRPLPLSRAV